jgi:hypothetical protein
MYSRPGIAVVTPEKAPFASCPNMLRSIPFQAGVHSILGDLRSERLDIDHDWTNHPPTIGGLTVMHDSITTGAVVNVSHT